MGEGVAHEGTLPQEKKGADDPGSRAEQLVSGITIIVSSRSRQRGMVRVAMTVPVVVPAQRDTHVDRRNTALIDVDQYSGYLQEGVRDLVETPGFNIHNNW